MKNKVLAVLLAVTMITLTACANSKPQAEPEQKETAAETAEEA